jgi:hypothetical protein
MHKATNIHCFFSWETIRTLNLTAIYLVFTILHHSGKIYKIENIFAIKSFRF